MESGQPQNVMKYGEQAKRNGEPRIKLPTSRYYTLEPYRDEKGQLKGSYYRPHPEIYTQGDGSGWRVIESVNAHGLWEEGRVSQYPEMSFGKYFSLVPLVYHRSDGLWILRRVNGEFWIAYEEEDLPILRRIHEPNSESFLEMLAEYYKQDRGHEFFPRERCLLGERVDFDNFQDYLDRERQGPIKPPSEYIH